MDDDVALIVAHADRVLPLATARLNDEYFYQSLPLCIIDAVYSMGVRYSGVQRVVARYCERFGLRRIRASREVVPPAHEQESIAAFCERVRELGVVDMADTVFRNRQRTSYRNGILKADAVSRFACVLNAHGIQCLQDVSLVINDARLAMDIRSIPGQGSGISPGYFWMLAGAEDFVKPDRMILRFLQSALRRSVSPAEAQILLRGATDRLRLRYPQLTPRLLDHEIWKHQREHSACQTDDHNAASRHERANRPPAMRVSDHS